jgi:heme exporter protein A
MNEIHTNAQNAVTVVASPGAGLQITDLRVLRGLRLVINGLSHQQQPGDIYCLTGPNGAGKTTLLRTIANRLPLTGGQISCPVPVVYVGHDDGLSGSISGRQNLKGWAQINGFSYLTASIDKALASFATNEFADISTNCLSRGQRRRLALTRLNLAPANSLWLLDEPNASLDQATNAMLDSAVIAHAGGGGMVLAATHFDFAAAAVPQIIALPGRPE